MISLSEAVANFVWETFSPGMPMDGQGVVSLCTIPIVCVAPKGMVFTSTQSLGYLQACNSNKGINVPDSTVSLNFSSSESPVLVVLIFRNICHCYIAGIFPATARPFIG